MAPHCRRFFFSSNIYCKSDAFNIMVRVVICQTGISVIYPVMYFNTLSELDLKNNNNIKLGVIIFKYIFPLTSFLF